MTTNVYIDGFNLYYGCLKGTSYKWLDLEAFCTRLLPKDDVQRIRYFTARVIPRPDDPDVDKRQRAYLRALGTLPKVSVHLGHFLSYPTRMALANPPAVGSKTVEVIKTEEKGSDVNLASHLLMDVFTRDCDVAVVISNDGDLKEPLMMARRLGCTVGIVNPHSKGNPSKALASCASFYKGVRPSALSASQLPVTLSDGRGTFQKPQAW
jgi:uncharacterized LabA/DUF88 family protein